MTRAASDRARNDVPARARRVVVPLLGRQLADLIDLGLQAKHAHWNVKGPHFIGLHELFDRVASEASDFADDVAERVVQLGGVAHGTLPEVAASTRLAKFPSSARGGRDHVVALADALARVAASTRAAIDDAARAGDAGTADLMTEQSRGLDKLLWLVEAHLGAGD